MIPCASPLAPAPSVVTTRRATHQDVDALLPLLCRAAHEYPSARVPFPEDVRTAAATLHGLIGYGVVIVAEGVVEMVDEGDGGTWARRAVVGVIGGAVGRHPFDVSLLVLHHHFVVVSHAMRRQGVGALLLDAFDAEAEAQGVQWVTFALAANTPLAVDEALVARGYRESDRTYLREVAR